MQALRRYDIIQGRPALKTDAMLAEFQKRGGKVDWIRLDDECAEAEFHASGLVKPVRIKFDSADAKRAGLLDKDNWKKYPRAMRRARVVSEGIRTADPGVNAGVYTPEEVADFEEPKVEWPKALTKAEVQGKKERGELKGQQAWHQPIPSRVAEDAIETPDDESPAIFGSSEPEPFDERPIQEKLRAIEEAARKKWAGERAQDPEPEKPGPAFKAIDSQSMFKGTCEAPGCNAVLVTASSESSKYPGRPYITCHHALVERHRLRKEGKLNEREINTKYSHHTRYWEKEETPAS